MDVTFSLLLNEVQISSMLSSINTFLYFAKRLKLSQGVTFRYHRVKIVILSRQLFNSISINCIQQAPQHSLRPDLNRKTKLDLKVLYLMDESIRLCLLPFLRSTH